MTCVHEMRVDECNYCSPRAPTVDEVAGRLWAAAEVGERPKPAQCTAVVVPVPTTAHLDLLGDARDFDPLRHRITTSPLYSHTVLVTPPPDRAERLFDQLATARPEWVR